MPLWALSVRTLACRQCSRLSLLALQCQSRWSRRSQHRTLNYGIALRPSQPDEAILVPASPSFDNGDGGTPHNPTNRKMIGRDAVPMPVTPSSGKEGKGMHGRDNALTLSNADTQDPQEPNELHHRARRHLWWLKAQPRLLDERHRVLRSRRVYRILMFKFPSLSAHRPTRIWLRKGYRRRTVTGRRLSLRFRRKRAKRKVVRENQQTPDLKTVVISPMQTVARFPGPDGQLRHFPATEGKVWSTANPYTLARTYPFQAKVETSARQWTYWEREYAKIASFYATYRKRREDEDPQKPCFRLNATRLVDHIMNKVDGGQTVITAEDLKFGGGYHWRDVWEHVALWLLTDSPEQMIPFLLATHAIEDLENHLIEDSLLQLARYIKHTNDGTKMEALLDAFFTMTEQRPERELRFHNEFIYLLIKNASKERKLRMFETIRTCNVQVHAYTWLHFATHFANNDRFELGLEALLKAHKNGATWEGRKGHAFRSSCTTILRRSSEQPDGLRVCLRVVSTLVDLGVKFNLPICNVIMLNAIEAGDMKTAFAVYHSLKERGLKPDEVTFLVLLKGCRMNIDDVQLLDEVIREAISNIKVRKSEKVANSILHCLALHHSKHNPTTALSTLAEAYAQLFDLEPLKELELPISPTLQTRLAEDNLMPPTRHAMTFMIGATVQHYLTTATTPTANTKQILSLYTRWRTHVEHANRTADLRLAVLATTDHVANIFLSAFIRHPKTLLLAARVVRDLQHPLPSTAVLTRCKPTAQTWSIFLRGFTQHKQMKLAEQVLTYMRKQGIEPNHVTWNTLIRGYAQMQDVEGTVGALREAERAGLVWDLWTHRGLRQLKEKDRLEEELRNLKVAESLDFTSDLKDGIGQRLERVEDERNMAEGMRDEIVVEGFGDSAGEIAEQGGAYKPFR